MPDPGTDVEDDQPPEPAHHSSKGGLKNFIRSSPWVVISVGVHVVAFAMLGLFYVSQDRSGEADAPPLVVEISAPPELELPEPEEPPEEKIRKVIPDNVEAEISTVDQTISDPSTDAGDETSISETPDAGFTGGTSMGVGEGGHFGTRPSQYGGRPGAGRKGSGLGGSTQATELAVLNGMRWLLRHQNKDGSWTTHGFTDQCKANSKCQDVSEHSDDRFDEGLTGLAVLAFLGAGYTHESKQWITELDDKTKKYPIGGAIKRALQWLVKRQKNDGSFTESGPFMYNEAICALALSEAYGLTKSRSWKKPAQDAIDFLAKAQRPNPSDPTKLWGWRYDSREGIQAKQAEYPSPEAFAKELSDADTSVTGWVAMAFKSAKMAELVVPEESIQGALDFSRWIQTDSGLSGYQLPEQAGQPVEGQFDNYTYHASSMAAVNVCTRAFLAHDPDDEYFRKAADQMIKDLPKSGDELGVDYYYWYYATLALNQVDGPEAPKKTGKHWQTWNTAMTKALLGLQDLDEATCTHGGWITADRWAHEATPVYATAINVLTLEVYYRYPNAFGSGTAASARR